MGDIGESPLGLRGFSSHIPIYQPLNHFTSDPTHSAPDQFSEGKHITSCQVSVFFLKILICWGSTVAYMRL